MARQAVTFQDSTLQATETWDRTTGLYTKTAADGTVTQRPLTPEEDRQTADYDQAMKPPRQVRARYSEASFTAVALAGNSISVTFTWSVPFDDDTYGYDVAFPPQLVGKATWTETSKTAAALTIAVQAKTAAVAAATVSAMAYQV